MDIKRLIEISNQVIDLPWGLEYPPLNNAEGSAPYYRFLNYAAKEYGMKLAVECGTYLGYGAAHLALAKVEVVLTFDIHPRWDTHTLLKNFPNAYYMTLDSTSSRARFILEALCVEMKGIDLLFIDSEHDGATPTAEFDNFKTFMAPECLVCCDDILDPRMEEFWANLPGEKVELHHLHPAQYPGMVDPGFGISLIKR